MHRIAVILVSLLAASFTAAAQRTAYGEYFAGGGLLTSSTSLGMEVSFGSYLLDGYWAGGISAVNRAVREERSGEVVSLPHAELFGQLMWAPYRNRSRSLNTYVGGDIFVGWELLDPFKEIPSYIRRSILNAGYDKRRFIYGIAFRAEMEYFVTDLLAVVPVLRVPAAFRSQTRVLSWEAGVGVRFNF